jgi:hypothetical protein
MAKLAIDVKIMDLALECEHCINAGVGELLPQMVVVIRDSTFLSFCDPCSSAACNNSAGPSAAPSSIDRPRNEA